jgi:hypothetical protein
MNLILFKKLTNNLLEELINLNNKIYCLEYIIFKKNNDIYYYHTDTSYNRLIYNLLCTSDKSDFKSFLKNTICYETVETFINSCLNEKIIDYKVNETILKHFIKIKNKKYEIKEEDDLYFYYINKEKTYAILKKDNSIEDILHENVLKNIPKPNKIKNNYDKKDMLILIKICFDIFELQDWENPYKLVENN